MTISNKVTSGVLSGFLLMAACVPALAGPGNQRATVSTQSTTAANRDQAILGFLESITPASVQPRVQRCKPETLYSQHDVIGDPDACFLNHFDVRAGGVNQGAAPTF